MDVAAAGELSRVGLVACEPHCVQTVRPMSSVLRSVSRVTVPPQLAGPQGLPGARSRRALQPHPLSAACRKESCRSTSVRA